MKEKFGRNDPCSCGSGKKYKNCCLKKDQQAQQQRKQLFPTTLTGKRKFTAKVLSAGGMAKPQQSEQSEQQRPVDYNMLMERSFGNAIHDDDKPPVPSSSDQYLVQENENGRHPT